MADAENIQIIEAHLEDGDVVSGVPDDEQMQEADSVFYSVEVHGDTFYRWLSGPFEDVSSAYDAIEDNADFYTEAA